MAPRGSKKAADAANTEPGGNEKPTPTAAEAHMFYTLIKNMKSKPEIDWDAVAVDNGFKNADTAKVRFGQIKRKLGLDAFTGGSPSSGASSTPKTPRASKAKKGDKESADTPGSGTLEKGSGGVKKSRGTGKRGAKPKLEDFASDDVEPATPTKSRRGKAPAKSSPLKTEIKDETIDLDDGNSPSGSDIDSQDGEVDMEMDHEADNLGHISQRGYAAFKQEEDESDDLEVLGSGVVKSQAPVTGPGAVRTHPAYTSSTFDTIPAVNNKNTGNGYEGFNPTAARAAGGSYRAAPFPMTEEQRQSGSWFKQPGGIKEANSNTYIDDDGLEVPSLSSQLSSTNDMSTTSIGKTTARARSQTANHDNSAIRNPGFVNMASYMTGNLPGGGASTAYGGGSGSGGYIPEPEQWNNGGQEISDADFEMFTKPSGSGSNSNNQSGGGGGMGSIFGGGDGYYDNGDI